MAANKRSKLQDLASEVPGRCVIEEHPLLQWARAQHRKGGMMSEVIPGLFLGNKQAAADRELLRSKGIVAVCAVGAKQVFNDDLVYHHVSIEDDGSESMLRHFPAACHFISAQRRGGNVLVHCKGGISRSPTMAIAILLQCEELPLPIAMDICALARPAARPSEVFVRDLQEFSEVCKQRRAMLRWQRAAELASVEAVAELAERLPSPVRCREEAKTESQRLLEALVEQCTLETFGDSRPAPALLRESAKAAVQEYARSSGWFRLGH